MAEDLAPRGLPYGENDDALAAQRAAGLSTSSKHAAPARPTLTPAPSGQGRQPAARADAPMSDDPLQVLNPVSPLTVAPTPDQRLEAIVERAANPMMQMIAMRLRGG